ncbi:cytochrome-c peroxidase [Campylobacter fetus]|uniref:cytochrome-c peroxidase n=1 Tax=Campylobacter fetus TaxID=196 RepID=UPI000818BA6F|nr:cytochrome c peroxidase [Campylobacter fetus]
MIKLILLLGIITSLFAQIKDEIFIPITQQQPYNRQKAALGKELFIDKRLSKDKTISCETCHNLEIKATGTSDKITKDNPPTLLNVSLNFIFSKKGEIKNLSEQIKKSLTSDKELNTQESFIISQINKNPKYEAKFKNIYKDGVTFENSVDALTEFIKALNTPLSRFDKFLAGDKTALSEDEQKGFEAFIKYGCASCHNGINLGGNIISVMKNEIINTNEILKVPTLRNISLTKPYFHDGRVNELRDAIEMIRSRIHSGKHDEKECELIYKFLLTLEGNTPEILYE